MISATSGSVSMRDFSRSWEDIVSTDAILGYVVTAKTYVLLGFGEPIAVV